MEALPLPPPGGILGTLERTRVNVWLLRNGGYFSWFPKIETCSEFTWKPIKLFVPEGRKILLSFVYCISLKKELLAFSSGRSIPKCPARFSCNEAATSYGIYCFCSLNRASGPFPCKSLSFVPHRLYRYFAENCISRGMSTICPTHKRENSAGGTFHSLERYTPAWLSFWSWRDTRDSPLCIFIRAW